MSTALSSFGDAALLEVLARSTQATAVYDSADLRIRFVNDAMAVIWGKDRSVTGKTFEEAIPEMRDQPFAALLKHVWETGETYTACNMPADIVVNGLLQTFYFDFDYRAIRNETGETVCILHTAVDVTERRNVIDMRERLDEADAHFKTLAAQAPVAILVFRGEDMVIDIANRPMLDILHRNDDIIGKPILEGMPELKGEPAVQLLFDVYRTGKGTEGSEVPVRMLRDGVYETRYFNFSYRPLMDGGRIVGVMDLAVEVTDQVRSRERLEDIVAEKTALAGSLHANEQRLQGILDTMAEGVVIVNDAGKAVYANPMAQRILGVSESQIREHWYAGHVWHNLRIDGYALPADEHPMAIMMRTAMPIYDQEIAVRRPDGELVYISINAAPILDDRSVLTGGIATFMDVTKRRKVMMQKDDFISVASHELKTPVTAVKASLQLLARLHDAGKPEITQKLVIQANKSMDKLTGLIDELLNTNRINQGHLEIHKTLFTVSGMINDCCHHIRSAGTHTIVLQGDLGVSIYGDEQQLDQVLVNFINNAVKYAPAARRIVIDVKNFGDYVKISVTDFGPGIPPEKKPHLFDRYYRADYSGVQFSGLGLGLYICAEIIKRHGGEIGAESKVGEGSTFWFTVPAAK